jgi:hypothetical protein
VRSKGKRENSRRAEERKGIGEEQREEREYVRCTGIRGNREE